MYKKAKSGWLKHIDFIILDLICIEIAFILSFITRHHSLLFSGTWLIYQNIIIVIAVIHIFLSLFIEPYQNVLKRGHYEELKATVKYNLTLLAVLVLYLFIIQKSSNYSRTVFLVFPFVSFALTYASRNLLKFWIRYHSKTVSNDEHMFLITEHIDAKVIAGKLMRENYTNLHLKGIIVTDCDMIGEKIFGVPVVANSDTMYEYLTGQIVDEVVIHISDEEKRIELAENILDMGAVVHISITDLANLPNANVNHINKMTVVTTSNNVVTSRQLIIKRLIDIIFGLIGSFVTILATIIVGPMIYIKSPGPIFFRQERVGKNGRKFKIWKFRTMYMDAEKRKAELMEQNKMSGLMFKMDEDPRIIGSYIDGEGNYHAGIGGLLRKLSIDELPQSFNILFGSMSVVGTRPPTSGEYEQYAPHHKSRLAIKPGLTGMWQVSGRSDITDFEEVVKLDNDYIRNWSLALDMKIILKTFVVVLGRKGSV